MRYLYVKGGVVTNIVEHPTTPDHVSPDGDDIVPDPGNMSVGSAYDVTPDLAERRYECLDRMVLSELLRLTNEVRELQRKVGIVAQDAAKTADAISADDYKARLVAILP